MPITATELETSPTGHDTPGARRPPRLASTPEWLLRVTVESILIVMSILLALAVDEWQERRDFEALGQQSLYIFAQEIEQNLAMMNDVLPYHVGLQQVVTDMAAEPESVVDVHSIVEGLQPTVLLHTAWSTALATGAFRHMDVNTVSKLSRMYSLQQRFRDQITFGRPELFVSAATTPEQKLEQMQHALMYLNEIVRAEQELRGIYRLALEEIDAIAALRSDSMPGQQSMR